MEYAVYARQSVEKKNSLSIEGQIDLCRRTAGRTLRVYQDRGFSGKNTHRPAFLRLMEDIRSGLISKLYVYRLDRFSRSVADFGNLWETLQKHRVDFVSVSESFDTSTPMGRAMLHIIMVFAQLERETTAERVKDNYYKRAALGAWPGGPAPYGFTTGRMTDGSGRRLPALFIDPGRAAIVKRIYARYAQEDASLGGIAKELNAKGIPAPRRDTWDNVSLSRLLHSPVYVRADEQVRLYCLSLGADLAAPPESFDGEHGLLLVGRRPASGEAGTPSVSVLNSPGLIEPDLWLACQDKLSRNRQLKNGGKGTHTWLSGLLKCASCGYSVKVTETRSGRYLHCSGRYNLAKCGADLGADLSALESAAAGCIQKLLDEAPDAPASVTGNDAGENQLKELDRKAERIIAAYTGSSAVSFEYLERALEQIERQRNACREALARSAAAAALPQRIDFSALSFEEKKAVAGQFIQRISLSGDSAEIVWVV